MIARLASGWVVIGDVQPLPGYRLLLADPVVESPNALAEPDRARYFLDALLVGDALLEITPALADQLRELLGNLEPALHTHIIPRFRHEPDGKRLAPPMQAYD